jgi:hypothetical protein
MRTTLHRCAGTALAAAALAVAASVVLPSPAGAAPPDPAPASSPPWATTSAAPTDATDGDARDGGGHGDGGYDVSHPQCDVPLPAGAPFAVVGVNGGLASTPNPCLAEQLAWAAGSSGQAQQPGVQLYLNTADPGQLRRQVSTWPRVGSTPYGDCDGDNSTSCSWQYGWERARASVTGFFLPAATAAGVSGDPARYTWWLDVETANTWQTGSSAATARNRAALEGTTAYLTSRGARVGLYSTGREWDEIAGSVGWDSNLHRLPSWLAGSDDAEEALAACAADPLVAGGAVVLSQYVTDGIDRNVSCR